jgi:hypothetical protein
MGMLTFLVLGLIVPLGDFTMWPLAGLCFVGAIARAITQAANTGKAALARCNAVMPLDTPRGEQLLARPPTTQAAPAAAG